MVFVAFFLINTVIFLNFSRKRLIKQLHVDNGGMKADRQTTVGQFPASRHFQLMTLSNAVLLSHRNLETDSFTRSLGEECGVPFRARLQRHSELGSGPRSATHCATWGKSLQCP